MPLTAADLPDRFLACEVFEHETGYPDDVPCGAIAVRLIRPGRTGTLSGHDANYAPRPVVIAYDARHDCGGPDILVIERIDGVFVAR